MRRQYETIPRYVPHAVTGFALNPKRESIRFSGPIKRTDS